MKGRDLCILNIYGPHSADKELYYKMQQLLAAYVAIPILWTEDFNCVVDGNLDSPLPKQHTKPGMVTALGGE